MIFGGVAASIVRPAVFGVSLMTSWIVTDADGDVVEADHADRLAVGVERGRQVRQAKPEARSHDPVLRVGGAGH